MSEYCTKWYSTLMAPAPITNTLDMEAPIDTVWALTMDIESWPEISPTMTSVRRLDDGPIRVGSQALVKQPAQRPTTWTVTGLEAPTLFEWTARVLGVTVTASHVLEATSSGCRNTLSVEMSGRGSRLLAAIAGRQIRQAITLENEGFRAAATSDAGSATL